MARCPLRSLLLFFLSISLCSRGYIIDDRQVTFVPTSGTKAWQQFSDATAYGGTVTDNDCLTSDDCSFSFTFTGSGVSLTRVIVTGISIPLEATVTINGTAKPDISVPDGSTLTVVYDLQSLAYGVHSMVVTLVTYSGGVESHFRLDSITVNETVPATTTTTSRISSGATAAPSTTTTGKTAPQSSAASGQPPSSTSKKSNHLGAIVAAAVGGIVFLVLLVLLILCIRRRRRAPTEEAPAKLGPTTSSLFGPTVATRTQDVPPSRPAAAPPLFPLTSTPSGGTGSVTPPRARTQRPGWQTPPSSAPPAFPPPPIPTISGPITNRPRDPVDTVYGNTVLPPPGLPVTRGTSSDQPFTVAPIASTVSYSPGPLTNTNTRHAISQPTSSRPPLVTVPISNPTPTTRPAISQPISSGPQLVTVPVSNPALRPENSPGALSTTSDPSTGSVYSTNTLTQAGFSSNVSSPTPSRYLTEDEVDFVAGLYRQRLPPTDVARVVETMLHGGPARSERAQTGLSPVEELPPAYDFSAKS